MQGQPPPTRPSDVPHIAAHRHSSGHRDELESGERCGCFYCLAVYPPSTIAAWTDGGTTALCPRCGIDSVIGDRSGYPITREFLQTMQRHWFGRT